MSNHKVYTKKEEYFNLPIYLLICILCVSPASATITFEKWFGSSYDDWGASVIQTPDQGYTIAGTCIFNVYLIKTDSLGDTIWTRTYGGYFPDEGASVVQTADLGYIITGRSSSYGAGAFDVYLIKTDSLGDTLWTKTYGGAAEDSGASVVQTADLGFIITGKTNSFGFGSYDIYLIKTDSLGDTLWTKTFGRLGLDWGASVVQTNDFGYVITGETEENVCLIKTDSLGNTLWTRWIGDEYRDYGTCVVQTADTGYIITGKNGDWHGAGWIYLIKTDSVGDTLWTRTLSSANYGTSVVQTTDLGYVVIGSRQRNVCLTKTDSSGNILWTRSFGGSGTEIGYSVNQTSDLGFIITGKTNSYGGGGYDVYLIKTDSLGYVGVNEDLTESDIQSSPVVTIFSGPLFFPEGKKCRVFDITGREVMLQHIKPGIYFIEIDGKISQKVVKIR